ncbi:cellulose binding domain-containing protein [Streptomyces sp. NPDC088729]|uniref:cellulose binding domain-containing protein n=1 Tax=Streptomyces sp. NPDC088729 TaxID=3365876 RepID=UPI0038049C7B
MSKSLVPPPATSRSLDASAPATPFIGRRLWDDESDPVDTYARLCTRTSTAAEALAARAGERTRASRQLEPSWAEELPTVPAALNTVLIVAMEMSSSPEEARVLAPDLLNRLTEHAADPGAEPWDPWASAETSLALRALCAMDPDDSELLWWSCVEGLPDTVVAERLDRPRAETAADLVRVTESFRERSSLIHRAQVQDPVCRSYASLLDAAARGSAPTTPPDLLEHLNGCLVCGTAFECLSRADDVLPGLVAEATLKWSGPAYVARRRRQLSQQPNGAEVRPSRSVRPAGRRVLPGGTEGRTTGSSAGRSRLMKAAGIGTGLVLLGGGMLVLHDASQQDARPASSLLRPGVQRELPGSGAPDDAPEVSRKPGGPDRSATADPSASAPAEDRETVSPSPSDRTPEEDEDKPSRPPSQACSADVRIRNQWNEGIEADLNITSDTALEAGWQLTFRVPDKARVQVWNGTATTTGDLVTVTAADYNRTVPSRGTLSVGVVVDFAYDDAYAPAAWVSDARVDGRTCPL